MIKLEPGTIETVYKIINSTVDPVAFFSNLKTNRDAFLLESADVIEKYGEKSTGCVDPCLKVTIKNGNFIIRALSPMGEKYLDYLSGDFSFAKDLSIDKTTIEGRVERSKELTDEESRLKEPGVFDILRIVAFKLKPKFKLHIPFCGLFGIIGYDAIDYFEDLPRQTDDDVPDIEFYFATNLFVIDHLQNKTYLIANTLVIDENSQEDYYNSLDTIKKYEKIFHETKEYPAPGRPKTGKITISVPDNKFEKMVENIKGHISEGDIFQCVISRSFKMKIVENSLDIYTRLKSINPGPYMFYFQTNDYALIGSSPETCLKVSGDTEKTVEIKPIAGTLPRGKRGEDIDPELDGRYQLELLNDEKELAEHCMLLDLARNDIAKVSIPATRITPQILQTEKFSHVQHLVSDVQGKLRPDLDAIHAYVATMNMGTLTGAPKIKAMELIRKYEKEKRGFYGGSVFYMTPNGEFDSCIIIRAIYIKDNIADVRAGAGIVFDSKPKEEAKETKRKAGACLKALGVKS